MNMIFYTPPDRFFFKIVNYFFCIFGKKIAYTFFYYNWKIKLRNKHEKPEIKWKTK